MTAAADRYRTEHGEVQLTGVQALVRLPFDVLRADRRAGRATSAFVSGYEGSPLGGYDLELGRNAELIAETGLVFRPGVNEELAATAVQGSQLASASAERTVDGVAGFWYGKTPGLDRAADALRHANLMGTAPSGGAVAFVGDDPAAKSSTLPGACEPLLADLGMPVLVPSDPQHALDLGRHAVALSRACGLWVGMKISTNVADASGTVCVDPGRVEPVEPPDAVRHNVSARLVQPVIGELERSRDGVRLQAARRYAAANGLNRIRDARPGQRFGIVAAGKTFLDVRAALRTLGLVEGEVRLLQMEMVHPLEPGVVHAFAAGLDEIVVVEEKRPFLESALRDLLYDEPGAPRITGKRRGIALPFDGELDADTVAGALGARLIEVGGFPAAQVWSDRRRRAAPERRLLPLVHRTPYFCSGCPHNVSTRVPEGSLVGAGIGCHAMVALMEPDRVGEITGMTQMGGEGAQWIGMAPFVARDHLIQNLGDGTFHHSGSLAVRAAVAAGAHVTYKLLYNSAVAMTGGQQAVGAMSVPEIARELLAEGVARVLITTEDRRRYRRVRLPRGVAVWHRDRLEEAQRVLAAVPGVTVLIHDQECATELRRKRKRGTLPDPAELVMINERVCEGCGDCGRVSNCLSVQPVPTAFGRKTRIDQSTCNKDYSCVDGDCPAFMTVTRPRRTSTEVVAPGLDLPEPPVTATAHGGHAIRMTGIGGTGVVTLAQVLGRAAALAGLEVRALDQTGLAQKGGAVVSDLRLTERGADPVAHKLAAGECDLYLACDLLVGATAANLAVTDPGRTTAVVSTAKVPTGAMVVDTGVAFPDDDETVARIRAATRPGGTYLDARRIALALVGDEQFANMLLAGAAYQHGALPIPAHDVEEAIRSNGVRVEANLTAFRRGRQSVADPRALQDVLARPGEPEPGPDPAEVTEVAGTVRAAPGSALGELVLGRVRELVAYQDAGYARRFAARVETVRAAEERAVPGSTELAEAAAWSLHKLMAYKDEYEVARLLLSSGTDAAVREQFGDGARVTFRLHPPALRAMGWRHKIRLGPWARPALRLLRASRRLRGSGFDPFGRSEVRRTERALVTEFEELLDELSAALTPADHAVAVEIAGLPDVVRGYEQIKLDSVAVYRERVAELRTRMRQEVAAA